MTLGSLAQLFIRAARVLRDVNAVRRGRIWQRIANRLIGKGIGRASRPLWR